MREFTGVGTEGLVRKMRTDNRPMRLRQAIVDSVSGGIANIRLADTDTPVPARALGWYQPVVGDSVWVLENQPDLLILGRLDQMNEGIFSRGMVHKNVVGIVANEPGVILLAKRGSGAPPARVIGRFIAYRSHGSGAFTSATMDVNVTLAANGGGEASLVIQRSAYGPIINLGICTYEGSGWWGIYTNATSHVNPHVIDFTGTANPDELRGVPFSEVTNWTTTSNGIVDVQGRFNGETGWITASLQNGWGHYQGSYGTAKYRKDQSGTVHLEGLVRDGTSNVIFTLPAGFRPHQQLIFHQRASGAGSSRVDVYTDGRVYISGTIESWVSIAGIVFSADQ